MYHVSRVEWELTHCVILVDVLRGFRIGCDDITLSIPTARQLTCSKSCDRRLFELKQCTIWFISSLLLIIHQIPSSASRELMKEPSNTFLYDVGKTISESEPLSFPCIHRVPNLGRRVLTDVFNLTINKSSRIRQFDLRRSDNYGTIKVSNFTLASNLIVDINRSRASAPN